MTEQSVSPPLRVLVAEDNLVNQRVVGAFLKRVGCEVTMVANGLEAIDAFLADGTDLLLMDCNMPEMDGIEATRRIRELELQRALPRTPIVALTAHAFSEIVQQCRDAGMDEHLAKPIIFDDLRVLIERWSRRSG